MGFKKLKKCKVKCKRYRRSLKSSKRSPARNVSTDINDEKFSSEESYVNDETENADTYSNRLLKQSKYTRLPEIQTPQMNLNRFSQIRESYFKHLQRTVDDNYRRYFRETLESEFLENLSLELEQPPLLACMQAEIYQKLMTDLICDIKQCTKGGVLHFGIHSLIRTANDEHLPCVVKVEEKDPETPVQTECTSTSPPPSTNTYSRIPTICTNRSENESFEYFNDGLENQPANYSSNEFFTEASQSVADEINFSEVSNPYMYQPDLSTCYNTSQPIYHYDSEQQNSNYNSPSLDGSNFIPSVDMYTPKKPISRVPPQPIFDDTDEKIDPILAARSQLQKSIEKTMDHVHKTKLKKNEEKERAEIAHILEGDDSLDDRICEAEAYGSNSDPESHGNVSVDDINDDSIDRSISKAFDPETKKVNSPLSERVQKMRQIFGMDDDDDDDDDNDNKEDNNNDDHNHNEEAEELEDIKPEYKVLQIHKIEEKPKRRPTIWRHERNIQMHKYSILASQMTESMREKNRAKFFEYFGEDSDEEHEDEFYSEENYLNSCVERISTWVVKYLMPFYHQKRIIGKPVFKSLAHRTSELITDKIQYPDEWTVKYFVGKLFPHKKIYFNENDVWCASID